MANNITTTATGITQQPQWFQQALQGLVQQAQQTSNQGYTPYPNARIAGFTPAQQQAQSSVAANQGNYQPYFNNANTAYQQGANPQLNQSVFNSYQNPYTQDVVNQIQTLGNRNLTENVLPAVNATFTGAGQFGSSRNADFTNRALRDNQEAISQAQGQALASGFQNQVGNTQNAISQAMQSGQLQQGLGQATQAAGLTDASALSAVGQQQQNQNQSNENLAYQDFLTQQQWPYQQETYLSGILGGAPVATSTQSSQTTPGPSTTSQVLGGLAGLTGVLGESGAFNGIGSDISNFLGNIFAEGGSVGLGSDGWASDIPTGYKDGGDVGPDKPKKDDSDFNPFNLGISDAYADGGSAMLKMAIGGFVPGTGGFSMPKAPTPKMPAVRSRRPRLGGIATRRLGGIGMMPGGGTTGMLPGAPAGIAGRMPGAMNPGAASVMRGLSGMGTPAAVAAPRLV
jgi:hypothetical protein